MLLAAYAVALARVTGSNPAVIQVVVNNRFRRGFARMVSHLCNFGLCVIDVADITCDEAVARAWRSAVHAYKHGYCNPVMRADLVRRIGRERGQEIDLQCFLNDRRMQSRQEPGGQPQDPADVRAALPKSALTWGDRTDDPGERCYLHINDVPGIIQYELLADTRYVPPADIQAILRGLEAVTVEAALDPAAPTGIRP